MPLAILIVGIAFAVAALRNTHRQLGAQLASDISGSGGFAAWIAAILVIGLLGYIPNMQTPSRLLLGLIFLVLLLKNGGFLTNLANSLQSVGSTAALNVTEPKAPEPPVIKLDTGSAGGVSGGIGTAAGIAGTAAKIVPFLGL